MDPDASEPPGPGATASAVTPSLWSRIVANGAKPETRLPACNAAASWIRTAVSAADAVTTCCPPGPHAAEQRAGEPDLCASRSFTARLFMAVLRLGGFLGRVGENGNGFARLWKRSLGVRFGFVGYDSRHRKRMAADCAGKVVSAGRGRHRGHGWGNFQILCVGPANSGGSRFCNPAALILSDLR
jgi:hypothetical protein